MRIPALAAAMALAWAEAPPEYSSRTILADGAKEAAALAPGTIVSVYGYRLGPAVGCAGTAEAGRRQTASPLRPHQTPVELAVFPKRLCDVEVRVGGIAAGLLYVEATQINFQMPQEVGVKGAAEVRIQYKGQFGPAATVRLGSGPHTDSAARVAEAMWAGLKAVKWETPYRRLGSACGPIPVNSDLRAGLDGYAYHCSHSTAEVIGESFYYPAGESDPAALLRRADFWMAEVYPAMSAEVERLLSERLRRAYGPGTVPKGLFEIGAESPHPGWSWRVEETVVFLNRSRMYTTPVGLHEGVALIAVRREVLEGHAKEERVEEAFRTSTKLSQPVVEADLKAELGALYLAPGKPERETRAALPRLLREAKQGAPEKRAAMLVAADELTMRLGRSGFSGDRPGYAYDRSLLRQAWTEFPGTAWGQRAFLLLQQARCSVPVYPAQEAFRTVIEQGRKFLRDYPETPFRTEQLYYLAVANETEWSLSKAAADDETAEGSHVDRASGERARERAIAFYEELIRTAPGSAEAEAGWLVLPRLKMRLGTGQRTFFCFTD